jgi:hypothetical protein
LNADQVLEKIKLKTAKQLKDYENDVARIIKFRFTEPLDEEKPIAWQDHKVVFLCFDPFIFVWSRDEILFSKIFLL